VTAMSPIGFTAPADVISTPTPPDVTEALARHVVGRRLGFQRVSVKAPTWREILFTAGKIRFRLPRFPDGAAEKVDQDVDDGAINDEADKMADKLIADMSKDKPRGSSPRSISARKELPPSDDAMATWRRRATLTVLGPEVTRLLVASGGLLASDVDIFEDIYPAGLDIERRGAVAAAIAVTAAAARHDRDADLPAWLNDQLITLMSERRPTEFFQDLYKGAPPGDDQSNQPQGPSAGGPPSRLAEQNRPPAGEGIT